MKDKIMNGIRGFLIRTILPIREKKETFKRKFRLSLKLRIAYTYGRIMLIYGVIIVLIFFFIFLKICEMSFVKKMDEIVANINSNEELLDKDSLKNNIYAYYNDNGKDVKDRSVIKDYEDYIYKLRVNPYAGQDMTMRIVDDKDNIIYDDVEEYYVDRCNIGNIAYYSSNDDNSRFVFIEKRNIEINNNDCTIYFQIDFSREIIVFKDIFWVMILIILFISIILATGGIHRIDPIFQPIKQMADAANKMTVNNLSSDRLNLEGTKNELKDLAVTINSMLDRLDISYESQKQFVSNASHELRTPIAVIQGYVNMLDRWGKTDESVMDESIEAIKNEAQTMKELVEKLLFLSRHDRKTLKLDKKIINVKPLISDMIKETKLVVHNRNIDCPCLEDAYLYADKQSIKQALRILIDNAVKYSGDGAMIFISCKSDKDGRCIIEVMDTGFGMSRKDLDCAFERFYRSENVRNKKIIGNGLGLSLAKLIVLKHTGTITVTSQLNKGSSFMLSFPPVDYE